MKGIADELAAKPGPPPASSTTELGPRPPARRFKPRNRTAADIASATGWIPTRARRLVATPAGRRARARLPPASARVGADVGRQIDLVDNQQVAAHQAWAFLRGMSSPPATSMTNIHESTRSSEKVEARLSPPDSNRISSTPGKRASSSSPAAIFKVGSSRITVCGQAPASTADTRAGSISPERRSRSASSLVTRSLVTTAKSIPRRCSPGSAPRSVRSCPTRPGRRCRPAPRRRRTQRSYYRRSACNMFTSACNGEQGHFAGRLAGRERAVDEHVEGLGIDRDFRTRVVPEHVALRQLRVPPTGSMVLEIPSWPAIARHRQRMHEACRQAPPAPCRTRPIADASGSARRSSAMRRCRPWRPRR